MKNTRAKKGILLTLLMVIVFVLMLGSVITYVVINTSYDTLQSQQAQALSQVFSTTALAQNTQGFLHSSLQQALYAMVSYQGNPTLRAISPINNTAYFLQSMMLNGKYNGLSMQQIMGSATLSSFMNNSIQQSSAQQVGLKFGNGTIRVYQSSPFTVTAVYSALVSASTSGGSFTYPLSVNTTITINGTVDPYTLFQGPPTSIAASATLPQPVVIGGAAANSGSRSPFMTMYGTVIVANTAFSLAPTCSSLQYSANVFKSQYYILAVANALNIGTGACGYGGLITTVAPSATQNTPYLVYSTNTFVFNGLTNGTQALLDGPQLELLNITGLQTAVASGAYFSSNYLPSYLDRAQGFYTDKSPNGLFSLVSTSNFAPYFNGAQGVGINGIVVNVNSVMTSVPYVTVSAWVYPIYTASGTHYIASGSSLTNGMGGYQGWDLLVSGYAFQFSAAGNSVSLSVPSIKTAPEWYNVVGTYNGVMLVLYVDGQVVKTLSAPGGAIPYQTNSIDIGSFLGDGGLVFSGQIANFQLYDTALSTTEVHSIYTAGIAGAPVAPANLVADIPLNGNPNNYGASGFSSASYNVVYSGIANYSGDPILNGVQYPAPNPAEVFGVLGCQNPNACMNSTIPHLYLGNVSLEVSNTLAVLNERQAFGISNATLGPVLGLASGSSGYVTQKSSLPWMANTLQSFAMSIWIYPYSGNGVIIDEYNGTQSWSWSWLELYDGSLYARYRGDSCQNLGTIPTNSWSNIVLSYNVPGTQFITVVNGNAITQSGASSRTAPTNSVFYQLGANAVTNNCGSGAYYSGLMSDFQVFNAPLTANQASQLYLNNTVSGLQANMIWPLNAGYQGMMNTSSVIGGNDYGVFHNGASLCTNANSITGTCPVGYRAT